jgi:hypothetical protein
MGTIVSGTIIGIILVLLLALLIYKMFYTYRANKALKSGVPAKTVTPGIFLVSLILLFLIFANVYLIYNINSLTTRLSDIENQNLELIETINSLPDQILDYTKNTYDDKFSYLGVDDEQIIFNVSFKVKSLENDATITVLVDDLEGTITEYEVDQNELVYSADVSLDFSDSYKIYFKMMSDNNTYIDLIDHLIPYDILSNRFEIYPMSIAYHDNQFKVNVHNQLEMFDYLEGLEVDYIQLYYYNSKTGDEETITTREFTTSTGSNYLGDSIYIEAILEVENSQAKRSDITCYLTLFDKDGHAYSFRVEPNYTSSIN